MKASRILSTAGVLLILVGSATISSALAETIAIIGTGQVAGALGPEFAEQGHNIVYGSRDPERNEAASLAKRTGNDATVTTPKAAAKSADIVVLAVPGMLVEEITKGLGRLRGKIIIDPTNPLRRNKKNLFEHAIKTSNAQLIQKIAPDSDVVKAFNTLNWKTMVDPASSGGPVTIPMAGNSKKAKSVVAELIEGMGLEPIDLGPVEHAHYIEGMLILWLNNRYVSGQPFDYYLRKVPKD